MQLLRDKPVIGLIGDSPLVTSGFASCNRMLIDALMAKGYEVVTLGCLDTIPHFDTPYKIWPSHETDPLCEKKMIDFITHVNPDVLLCHHDPGTLASRLSLINLYAPRAIPIVAWFPVEGLPIHTSYPDVIKMATRSYCYTQMGCDALLAEIDDDVQPHCEKQTLGWNHAPFRVFAPEVRDHLRHVCGLSHSFLVGNVAFNKRGNRHPAIIEASVLSGAMGDPIIYYLHTNPREHLGLQGWPLEAVRYQYKAEYCFFKQDGRSTYNGVRYDDLTTDDAYLAIQKPATGPEQEQLFHSLSLIAKYNLMDLYIDPSSVQGYNLPTVEAAACGVPVISVDDGACRTELFSELAVELWQPCAWDYWHTTAKLALVSAEQIAQSVGMWHCVWKEMPDEYARLRARSRAIAEREHQWDLTPILTGIDDILAAPDVEKAMRTLHFSNRPLTIKGPLHQQAPVIP